MVRATAIGPTRLRLLADVEIEPDEAPTCHISVFDDVMLSDIVHEKWESLLY